MFEKILTGVGTFQRQVFPKQRELFARLRRGQRPRALFITCSDSRIIPSLVTQSEPGDLFVVRNAGNIVPPYSAGGGEAASVEYAVRVLEVPHIIVSGHSHCGAMGALLDPDSVRDLPGVAGWLDHAADVRAAVAAVGRERPDTEPLRLAIEQNVIRQLEHLRGYPCVAARIAEGTLALHGWVYTFETGAIEAYEPDRDRFIPLEQAARLSRREDGGSQ